MELNNPIFKLPIIHYHVGGPYGPPYKIFSVNGGWLLNYDKLYCLANY